MMIMITAFVLGAAFGWVRAARRKAERLDRLHYAVVHGLAFLVVALFVSVVAGWQFS